MGKPAQDLVRARVGGREGRIAGRSHDENKRSGRDGRGMSGDGGGVVSVARSLQAFTAGFTSGCLYRGDRGAQAQLRTLGLANQTIYNNTFTVIKRWF
jgi:hypothetical protein